MWAPYRQTVPIGRLEKRGGHPADAVAGSFAGRLPAAGAPVVGRRRRCAGAVFDGGRRVPAVAGPTGVRARAPALVPGGTRVSSAPGLRVRGGRCAACAFTLDGRSVRFRAAKTTPAKAGRFVAVWQRSEEGPIRPFGADGGVDLFVIGSCDDDGFGRLVFPREVSCERTIFSCNGSGGRRGFRVHPPWVTTADRQAQARSAQAWQVDHFFGLGRDGLADLTLAHTLHHPQVPRCATASGDPEQHGGRTSEGVAVRVAQRLLVPAAGGELQHAVMTAARAAAVLAHGGRAALQAADGALEPGDAVAAQWSDPHTNLPHDLLNC